MEGKEQKSRPRAVGSSAESRSCRVKAEGSVIEVYPFTTTMQQACWVQIAGGSSVVWTGCRACNPGAACSGQLQLGHGLSQ